MKKENNLIYEDLSIVDNPESTDPWFGQEIKSITREHIKALLEGKYLYIVVEDEYTILLKMVDL